MAQMQIESLKVELKQKRICCFCLSQNEPLTNIYSEKNTLKSSAPLPSTLQACPSIEGFNNDGMPNTVCETCRMFLEHYDLFLEMRKKANMAFSQYPSTGILPQPLVIPKISEEFILKNYPNLCRKPETKPIPLAPKINTTEPSSAGQSTSGMPQKATVNPTEKMLKKNSNIYQFKIVLIGSCPPIWRRIQVPQKYSFWDLHRAIQNAMGWWDCHLHRFGIINPETGEDDLSDISLDLDFEYKEKAIEIAKYFRSPNDTSGYEYDFGDHWQHVIILENILPAVAGMQYPQCVGGEMACPPEDCGGLGGYFRLVDPRSGCYAERKQWLKSNGIIDYDPVKFDPKSVKFDNLEEL